MNTDDDAIAGATGLLTALAISALYFAMAMLVGCAKDAPAFVTLTTPALPTVCEPSPAKVAKVKADLPEGWASDAAAVRDRETWRRQVESLQGKQAACWIQLNTLFPQPKPAEKPKTTKGAPVS